MASRRVRPAGGYELAWWYFMRISGIVLVFLALGHLFIMHIINNVEKVNYAFVANRWADPETGVLWRLWDLAMVNLAVLHGFNGLREILYEYIVRPSRRILASTLIWAFTAFLIVVGSYAILLFQSDEDYLERFRSANPQLVQADVAPSAEITPPPALPAHGN
jgi:succinate dehydrogenase / fumarate reductase membrane anchor subunit